MIDISEMALEILLDHPKGIHVDEISLLILEKYQNLQIDADELSTKLSNKLSYEFKKGKESRFSKLKNRTGGYKRGIYRAKAKRKVTTNPIVIEKPVTPSTNFTGSAGEHSVLSELLFRGFNAAIMAVDEGIDVVASKDNRYFHIQVKTSSESASGFSFTIKRHIFDNNDVSSTFYVLLCRRYMNSHFQNDFVVLASSVVSNFINSKVILDKSTLSLRLKIEDGKFILNNSEDVSHYVNRYDLIK